MASQWGDNFQYDGKLPDFVRQEYATFEDMKAVKKTKMPELYIGYCLEDRQYYIYDKQSTEDPKTGLWHVWEGGGSSGVETMPDPGATYEGKILQYIGPDDGNFKQGFFYICNSTHHYEKLPIETVDKMKEQINLNGQEVTLRNMFGKEYNTKALVKDDVYYFIQDDTVFSGTKVNVVVNTLDELKNLIETSDGTITLETPNGTRHQLQAWPYNNKWYFEFNTFTYQGTNVDDILKSRADLWTMISTSNDTVIVDYGGGITEERPAYLFDDKAYVILTGQIYGGQNINGTLFYPDAHSIPDDAATEAEGIVLGQIVYLADSTVIETNEQVVALDLVMRQVIDYDPGVNPKYVTNEAIAAIGLTWLWDEVTYAWDMQPVSPSGEEPTPIPISEIDELFD